jgi:predicted component of type VI protein secretion system
LDHSKKPLDWIVDLFSQARKAGLPIYCKTNLGISNRPQELPFRAPVVGDLTKAPKVFDYLGKAQDAA